MSSLIDQLAAMESEAGTLIEQAKAEAETLQQQADVRIETIKKDLAAVLEQKVLAFTAEAQADFEKASTSLEDKIRKTCAGLDGISSERLSAQDDKLVARFREI